MNPYLIAVLLFILISFFLNLIVEKKNLGCIQTELPEEFKDCYDAEKYKKPSTGRRPASVGRQTHSAYTVLVSGRSGRQLVGDEDPVKKHGPGAVADLRVVTPSGDPG